MAKAKPTFNPGGYTVWGVRRTLNEALNAARWSPWSTIQWMEEARNHLTITHPAYDEFDRVAIKINALWRSLEQHRWFNAREFWLRGTVVYPAQRIKLLSEQDLDYRSVSVSDLFKI